LLLVVC